jgi:hypothetical protein
MQDLHLYQVEDQADNCDSKHGFADNFWLGLKSVNRLSNKERCDEPNAKYAQKSSEHFSAMVAPAVFGGRIALCNNQSNDRKANADHV